MSEPITALATIRKALGRDARDLELLVHRVRQLIDRIPASTHRREVDDLPEEPDEEDDLRSTLQCLLADHLEPAVRGLRSAARLEETRRAE